MTIRAEARFAQQMIELLWAMRRTAPPENMLNIPRMPLDWPANACWNAATHCCMSVAHVGPFVPKLSSVVCTLSMACC